MRLQAKNISDTVLDGVAGVVNNATGVKFEAQVEEARDTADKTIGTE